MNVAGEFLLPVNAKTRLQLELSPDEYHIMVAGYAMLTAIVNGEMMDALQLKMALSDAPVAALLSFKTKLLTAGEGVGIDPLAPLEDYVWLTLTE